MGVGGWGQRTWLPEVGCCNPGAQTFGFSPSCCLWYFSVPSLPNTLVCVSACTHTHTHTELLSVWESQDNNLDGILSWEEKGRRRGGRFPSQVPSFWVFLQAASLGLSWGPKAWS